MQFLQPHPSLSKYLRPYIHLSHPLNKQNLDHTEDLSFHANDYESHAKFTELAHEVQSTSNLEHLKQLPLQDSHSLHHGRHRTLSTPCFGLNVCRQIVNTFSRQATISTFRSQCLSICWKLMIHIQEVSKFHRQYFMAPRRSMYHFYLELNMLECYPGLL